MITVVNNEYGFDESAYNCDNAYSNMSLAEACGQLQIDTINAVNEFEMSLLLAEHAYLYENGHEVSYTDEYGYLNENGKTVFGKIKDLIDNIVKKISDAFDKLVAWVGQRIDDVLMFFKKAGISKKAAEQACKFYKGGAKAKIKVVRGISDMDAKQVANWATNKIKVISNANWTNTKIDDGHTTFYNNIVEDNETEKVISPDDAQKAIGIVFNKENFIQHIIRTKRETIHTLQGLIKDAKKTDDSQDVEVLKDKIKYASKATSDCIKVYHQVVSNNIKILRAVMSEDDVKKAVRQDNKNKLLYKSDKKKEATSESASFYGDYYFV